MGESVSLSCLSFRHLFIGWYLAQTSSFPIGYSAFGKVVASYPTLLVAYPHCFSRISGSEVGESLSLRENLSVNMVGVRQSVRSFPVSFLFKRTECGMGGGAHLDPGSSLGFATSLLHNWGQPLVFSFFHCQMKIITRLDIEQDFLFSQYMFTEYLLFSKYCSRLSVEQYAKHVCPSRVYVLT